MKLVRKLSAGINTWSTVRILVMTALLCGGLFCFSTVVVYIGVGRTYYTLPSEISATRLAYDLTATAYTLPAPAVSSAATATQPELQLSSADVVAQTVPLYGTATPTIMLFELPAQAVSIPSPTVQPSTAVLEVVATSPPAMAATATFFNETEILKQEEREPENSPLDLGTKIVMAIANLGLIVINAWITWREVRYEIRGLAPVVAVLGTLASVVATTMALFFAPWLLHQLVLVSVVLMGIFCLFTRDFTPLGFLLGEIGILISTILLFREIDMYPHLPVLMIFAALAIFLIETWGEKDTGHGLTIIGIYLAIQVGAYVVVRGVLHLLSPNTTPDLTILTYGVNLLIMVLCLLKIDKPIKKKEVYEVLADPLLVCNGMLTLTIILNLF